MDKKETETQEAIRKKHSFIKRKNKQINKLGNEATTPNSLSLGSQTWEDNSGLFHCNKAGIRSFCTKFD